jgi:hypothetical protein
MVGRPLDPQLATIHRLARASKEPPLIRELPDGAVHLIVAAKGVVQHYYVDAGGAATNVETADKVDQWRLGNTIVVVGVLVFLVAFVAPPLGVLDHTPFGALMVAWIVGLILMFLGDHTRASSFAPMRKFADYGWSRLESLQRGDKWAPLSYATVPQLGTIERLALAHGRYAAMRDLGDDGIEVVTKIAWGLERRIVTRSGAFLFPPPSPPSEDHVFSFGSLAKRARRAYGGAEGEWAELDLRPGGD